MNMDEFKSAWNDASGNMPPQRPVIIKNPVLQQVKRQLLIEGGAWTVFLAVFYDFFDGDRKPLYLNILLVAAILLMQVHNLVGYLAARNVISAGNLKTSLRTYAAKLRAFGLTAAGCRLAAIGILLWFFTSVITFTTAKYWLLAGATALVLVQAYAQYRIWTGRAKRVEEAVASL